jgi:hypothetical protein
MKRSIIAAAFMTMLLCSSCGHSTSAEPVSSTAPESESTTESAEETTASISIESLSGTYVGKNGSVLTLFPDGTSEYYFMSSNMLDSGAGTWKFENNMLEWEYSGNMITAYIDDLTPQLFTFDTANGWIKEDYFKVSDLAETKTASQCRDILRKGIGRQEMDNFDSENNRKISIGANVVEIPFYWDLSESDSGKKYNYCAERYDEENLFALLYINCIENPHTDQEFESMAEQIWYNGIEGVRKNGAECEITKEPYKISPNGRFGVVGSCTVTDLNGNVMDTTIAVINDADAGNMIMFDLITSGDTIFQYNSDFEKIINSISSLSDGTDKVTSNDNSSATDPETKSSEASGVTPELKEFLDSYEAFMDEYIEFMQKYQNSNNAPEMLEDYLAMMKEYGRFAETLSKYDKDQMSAADFEYYLDVVTRVEKKMYSSISQ